MGATLTEDEIESFVKGLQSVADRIRLTDEEEHVVVTLLAFSSRESGHRADRNDQHDLKKNTKPSSAQSRASILNRSSYQAQNRLSNSPGFWKGLR